MEVIIHGRPKEIAALVVAIQERHGPGIVADSENLAQIVRNTLSSCEPIKLGSRLSEGK